MSADGDQGDHDQEAPTPPPHAGTLNLRPFEKGAERTRAAARRSVAVREAKRAAMRGDAEAVAARLAKLTAVHERDQLGPQAAAVASDLLARLASGEIPIRHAADAAELLRALHDITRSESGQPTSTALIAHFGSPGVAEVLALRDRARGALTAPPLTIEHGETAE